METIKNLVVAILNRAVAGYIRRNHILVVGVAGSIGKTSTTRAIRTVLAQKYKVHIPKTTYNTNRSIHIELFDLPFATSTAGWLVMVCKVLWRSLGRAPYEVVVAEIGTDHPGELRTFAWLKPKVGVLTAIAPEHMEYFKTLDAVAKEELAIASFSQRLLCNANTVDRKHVPDKIAAQAIWYGKDQEFDAGAYRAGNWHTLADFKVREHELKDVQLTVLGEHSLDALVAAAAVGMECGLELPAIRSGLEAVRPVRGRMQRLRGIQDSTIIDDTYNASPQACRAALQVLAGTKAPQRIALLGTMNEMGDYSEQAHSEVGNNCDPEHIDLVVTLGHDANTFLAAAAEARGCTVVRCQSPHEAGEAIRERMQAGAAILAKGSQNGVFAEEAVKVLLADAADAGLLPRQSEYWMNIKRKQFSDLPPGAASMQPAEVKG